MAKTSGEIENEFIKNIKQKTGKTLKQWLALIRESGQRNRETIHAWLRKRYMLDYLQAQLLAGIYLNNGKPVYKSDMNNPYFKNVLNLVVQSLNKINMKIKNLLVVVVITMSLWSCNNTDQGAKEYRIAYTIHLPDTTKDDYEIMSMNMDGSDKKNITNNGDVAWAYYAYKDNLFFVSDRDTTYRNYFLYRMDADGNEVKKVTGLRLEDSWMSSRKNGEELVVTGRVGKAVRYQLYLVDTQTGNYKQLTTDTSAYHSDPCFSPDGKQIVFSYKKDRRDRTAFEELYVMNVEGGEMKQITHYPADNPSAKEYGYRAGSARWHPKGNFISYVSLQDGRHSIFAVTPDGQKQWKLIDNAESEGWHDWSPDGEWLVFNASDKAESRYDIVLMNWQTKEKKQLTDSTYKTQQAPVFVEKKKIKE